MKQTETFCRLMWAVLAFIGLCCPVLAQTAAPEIVWTKAYNNGLDSEVHSVKQTADGGYILGGFTYNSTNESTDTYLIKVDAQGNKSWSKTYGGNSSDYAYSVQQTRDRGYVLIGQTHSFSSDGAMYLVKTDSTGNVLWQKTYGGIYTDEGRAVQQTADGGYILVGESHVFDTIISGTTFKQDQVYLVKTDNNGNIKWEKTFGRRSSSDKGYSVQQTADGGYIVAGSADDGDRFMYLIKTDGSGNKQWEKTFGKDTDNIAYSVQQTKDGGYILAGHTNYSMTYPGYEIYLVKTDPNGNLIWDKVYGGGINSDEAYSVQQTNDGDYVIAGYSFKDRTVGNDMYISKVNPFGELIWEKFVHVGNDYAHAIQQTKEGDFIVAGYTYSGGQESAYLVKLKGEGFEQLIQVKWPRYSDQAWPDPTDDRPILCEIRVKKPDGRVVYKGKTRASGKLLVKGVATGDIIQVEQVGFPEQARGEYTVTQTGTLSEALSIPISPAFMSPKLN